MSALHILCLTIEVHLPGCSSLKEKRGRLQPLIAELHKRYNVSVAEVDHQDAHQRATLACALVSNSQAHAHSLLSRIPPWIERRRPDLQITDQDLSPW